MSKQPKITILIPCYNEETTIGTVLANMSSVRPFEIVVVDDGSTDNSTKIVKSFKQLLPPVHLIEMEQNGGAGAALQKGIEYCKTTATDYVITVDADNQHSLVDVKKLIAEVKQNPEKLIVSGVRDFDETIPTNKKFVNLVASLTFQILYGISHPDPMCGLRAYHKDVLKYIKLENGYDWIVSINRLIRDLRDHSSTISIQAIYSTYSMSKGQSIKSGAKMFFRMLWNRIKEIILYPFHRFQSHPKSI